MARTRGYPYVPEPVTPSPSGCQLAPFHATMLLTSTFPAWVRLPPATSSPLNVAKAFGILDIPGAMLCHAAPSQRDTANAVTSPALVKAPPAIRSPLNVVSEWMRLLE